MAQLVHCPNCGGMAHYVAGNVRCRNCEAHSPPLPVKPCPPRVAGVSRPAPPFKPTKQVLPTDGRLAIIVAILMAVMTVGIAGVSLVVVARKTGYLRGNPDLKSSPTAPRSRVVSKRTGSDGKERKNTTGAPSHSLDQLSAGVDPFRHDAKRIEAFPGAADYTLKGLIANLETKLAIESVMYLTFDGRPSAKVGFPGHQAAQQRAEEQFDTAIDTELSDAFMGTIETEALQKTVEIVKYESPQMARNKSEVEVLRGGRMIWSWDCFYFVGDPVEIRRIERVLTGK